MGDSDLDEDLESESSKVSITADNGLCATNPSSDGGASYDRQYPASSKGPFTVYIREVSASAPLSPIQFAVFISKKYKSVVHSKRNHNKMVFTFSEREDANNLVKDVKFTNYQVYIPSAHVETVGAVNFIDLCDMTDIGELLQFGKGHFNNTVLQPVKIVAIQRLPKRSDNGSVSLTNTVKITFDGRILPDYVVIGCLRVRVRTFYNKPMFCERCQQFNHTAKFCTRKLKCPICLGEHNKEHCEMNNVDRSVCPYCNSKHDAGQQNCSYFREVTESYKQVQEKKLRSRYLNAINSLENPQPSDIALDKSQFPELNNRFNILDTQEPSTSSTSNEAPSNIPAVRNTLTNPWSPSRQAAKAQKRPWDKSNTITSTSASYTHRTTSPQKNDRPPGFQKSPESRASNGHANTNVDPMSSNISVSSNIKTLCNLVMGILHSSGVSPFWIGIIESILPAVISVILPNTTTHSSSVIPKYPGHSVS